MQISILPNLRTLPAWKLWHCAAILLLNIYFAALVQRHAAGAGSGRFELGKDCLVGRVEEGELGFAWQPDCRTSPRSRLQPLNYRHIWDYCNPYHWAQLHPSHWAILSHLQYKAQLAAIATKLSAGTHKSHRNRTTLGIADNTNTISNRSNTPFKQLSKTRAADFRP